MGKVLRPLEHNLQSKLKEKKSSLKRKHITHILYNFSTYLAYPMEIGECLDTFYKVDLSLNLFSSNISM